MLGIPYMNSKFENSILENLMEQSLNFIPDKADIKKITLYKDEDKKIFDEFMVKFRNFMQSEDKTLYIPKYKNFLVSYIINNIHEEIRKILYFEYSTLEK